MRGNQSPLTRYGASRDYGSFPLQPDLALSYYGPGFKLDFPDQAGNCAACHMPGEALERPLGTDVNRIPPSAVQGTHCDFCHKIAGVITDPATGLPYENSPGTLSLRLNRPEDGRQVFFGPYDDVDVGPDSMLPLQNQSLACAACHAASFWGTPIYNSYGEWLDSPYPQEGVTCQTCHMAPDGITRNFAPSHGGEEREPQTVYSHTFPGAADEQLLQNTARLEAAAVRQGSKIALQIKVTNQNGGHDIPNRQSLA